MTTSAESWTLTVVPDAATVGRRAADVVAEVVDANPDGVLAVPTGQTPLGLFTDLAERVARQELDLSRVSLVCLDEYVGLGPADSNSLTRWLRDALMTPARIDPARVVTLPVTDDDLAAGAVRYEAELMKRGGLDLAVLGLGPNGHIAYNEPGSIATSRTRVVDLTGESLARAAEDWTGSEAVPKQAMTIGVGTLLDARRLVLIVTGAAKAEMLRRAMRETPSAVVPASWLRMAGSRLIVIADEAAATRL
jgi:glucosamine-6-phosphate deaminase